VVAGLLSGELDLALAPAGVALVPAGEAPASGTGAGAGASGTVRLLLERGSLRELPLIGGSLPEVGIDRATASARVVPDRLDVEALEARGPQASLAASARVGLRRPVEASTLEGTVRLRPERALPPALRQMLTAFSRPPDASGAFAYGLRGTLGAPSLRPL
jgi:type II secretion system protein N